MKFVKALLPLSVFAVGCSSSVPLPDPPPPRVKSEAIAPAETRMEDPFKISVEKELNDGQRLVVVAKVVARTDGVGGIPVLELAGYHDGSLLGKTTSVLPSTLRAGEQASVPLLLEVPGVTNYQLTMLWGAEAPQTKAENKGITVKNVEIFSDRSDCNQKTKNDPNCRIKLLVTGALTNDSGLIITQVVVGARIVPKHDLGSAVPQNVSNGVESRFEISGLKLLPGKERPVRLVLDQLIPELEAPQYIAQLRVIEAH